MIRSNIAGIEKQLWEMEVKQICIRNVRKPGGKNSSSGGQRKHIHRKLFIQRMLWYVIPRLGKNTERTQLNIQWHASKYTAALVYALSLGGSSLECSAVFHSAQYCMRLH